MQYDFSVFHVFDFAKFGLWGICGRKGAETLSTPPVKKRDSAKHKVAPC